MYTVQFLINQCTFCISDPPDVPQDAAATEFPSRRPDICLLLIDWDPPHDIDSLSIKRYIIRTSRESEIPQTTETTTLATFESPCNELTNLTINITAVDVCERMSKPTANFVPTLVVTDPSDITSTMSSMATTQAPAPSEYYSNCNIIIILLYTTM